MHPAESPDGPSQFDFEGVALPFLPNVARYAQLLTRDLSNAEDLTQETFLRAYQSWRTFRGGDCRKWLFTICRNVYLRDRQRSRRFVAADDPAEELRVARALYDQAATAGLDDLFHRVDIGPAIQAGIARLLPEYREVLLLVDIEDKTYADAAAIVGAPVGTIRSRLFRARRLLQEMLIEHAQDLGFAGRVECEAMAASDA
jgi:RNA polymerase sigma-70 factor (ECF subfamily)